MQQWYCHTYLAIGGPISPGPLSHGQKLRVDSPTFWLSIKSAFFTEWNWLKLTYLTKSDRNWQKRDLTGLKVDENLGRKPLKLPKISFWDFTWKVGQNTRVGPLYLRLGLSTCGWVFVAYGNWLGLSYSRFKFSLVFLLTVENRGGQFYLRCPPSGIFIWSFFLRFPHHN